MYFVLILEFMSQFNCVIIIFIQSQPYILYNASASASAWEKDLMNFDFS